MIARIQIDDAKIKAAIKELDDKLTELYGLADSIKREGTLQVVFTSEKEAAGE